MVPTFLTSHGPYYYPVYRVFPRQTFQIEYSGYLIVGHPVTLDIELEVRPKFECLLNWICLRLQLRSWRGYFAEPLSDGECFKSMYLIWLSVFVLLEDGNLKHHRSVAFCSQYYTMHHTQKPSNTKLITIFARAVYWSIYHTRKSNRQFCIPRMEKFSKISIPPHKFSDETSPLCSIINRTYI
jgi:hypothetical protein